jgi:hypothetical protein
MDLIGLTISYLKSYLQFHEKGIYPFGLGIGGGFQL